MSKRDEYWDTAPAFDGRKEIWDALRAAVNAFELKDFVLAQAIVDGANITLPQGSYFLFYLIFITVFACIHCMNHILLLKEFLPPAHPIESMAIKLRIQTI